MTQNNTPPRRHNKRSEDLLTIMERRRQRRKSTTTASQKTQSAPTPTKAAKDAPLVEPTLTPAQQRRNSIIALTLIPVTILGMGTAAATTVYSDIAKPFLAPESKCERVTKKFNRFRDETQQLLIGGSVANARQKTGLTDQDTLPLDDTSSAVWARLGNNSTAVQTLLTTTLMMENPETIPEGINRAGTHTITEVVSRPDDNEQQKISGTRTDADNTDQNQQRLNRIDYAGYINNDDHPKQALTRLSETVLKTINGDYDELLTTPSCEGNTGVRDVAMKTGDVVNLRNKTQDDIDALASRLRFAEVDSWCGTNDDPEHTRDMATQTIDRSKNLRDRIEKVRDKRSNLAGDLDQHISDLEQITGHVERLRDQVKDTPSCLAPGVPPTNLESQHDVIVKYHAELDDLYAQIMNASVAVNRHETETKDVLRSDNEKREKKRQEQEAKQREAEEKAQREAEERERKREERRQERERERQFSSTATTTSTNDPNIADHIDTQRRGELIDTNQPEPQPEVQPEPETYNEEPAIEYYE